MKGIQALHPMYSVLPVIINRDTPLGLYCEEHSRLAKNLYNAALFRVRQIFTAYGKDSLTENEREVMEEVKLMTEAGYPAVGQVIGYNALEKLMRVTKNPDFFSGLPKQTAQGILRQTTGDFSNWLTALKDYRMHPEKYLGKPRMPHYKKAELASFPVTNQDAVFRSGVLKLPKTKLTLPVSNLKEKDVLLKEVKVIPYYGKFIISLTFQCEDIPLRTDLPGTAAVDFGTDNFAAIVSTDRCCRIYKGGAVLSENRRFSRERAKAVAMITKGHEHMYADSRHLRNLSIKHDCFNRDQVHKVSRSIIEYCREHGCGTLVLGVNRFWKQRSGIGDANNQKFVQMPIAKLREKILYKAAAAGIAVIEQEESYTSKADITARDSMPVYGKEPSAPAFSGKRICRGLYRCANGLVINADCNGAANIMRKAIPDIWKDCRDYSFLSSPEVYGFKELNPKGIPLKRIGAA
ncbi:MAG: transposase [Lachnospiraceae bacterium]|nr:transposase [Lachnospiraceae bacterium]